MKQICAVFVLIYYWSVGGEEIKTHSSYLKENNHLF